MNFSNIKGENPEIPQYLKVIIKEVIINTYKPRKTANSRT
jgi:hypothetical protein